MKKKGKNNELKAFAFGAIYATDSTKPIRITFKISNSQILDRIISGKSRGLSPALKIKDWECSVCHEDYELCPHQKGMKYGNKKCYTIAKGITATELSVVDSPRDPRNRIFDLLLIYEKRNKKTYEWHGFGVNAENDRFVNIQKALDKKMVSEKAAFHFSRFFSINQIGNTSYP